MKLRTNSLKCAVYTATIYINYVFSPIMALMGKKHEIDSGDNSWALTVGMAFVVSMFFALKSILSKRTLRYGVNMILFPLVFFLFAFFIEYGLFSNDSIAGFTSYPITKWYMLSALYTWPAVFIAIDVATENSLNQIYKWLDVVAVLISLGMIPSLRTLGVDMALNMGGDNYQAIAYMGAFAEGILLYGIVSPYQDMRFKFFQQKIYKIISIVFIVINVAAVFISGGRGGALLLILNTALCIFSFNKSGKSVLKKVAISVVVLAFFGFFFGKFVTAYGLGDFINGGLERTFSYISGGKLDMSETSNRDDVYKIAIENINNHPVLGQGIFRTMSMYGGYPHNFFLEILVDGGFIYLFCWIAYLYYLFKSLFRLIKKDATKSYLLILAALPFLSLMFSGTYTSNSYLWFVIACVFTLKKTNRVNTPMVVS